MPYDQSESRRVSPAAFARLTARATALPRLAVVGEFSSGKSTLLNLLLGHEVLPTRITATASPGVWISYGDRSGHYIDASGAEQPLPAGGIEAVPPDSRYIRLWLEADFLQQCDILDLSGLADPGRSDEMTYQMLGHAHAVIWCTPATQAWRQSERAAWLAVPPRLRSNSILAVTRMDKLRNDFDRERVMRRVGHEAAGLFSRFEPISALMALKALAENDAPAWEDSGIDSLMAGISEQLERLKARRAALMQRYQSDNAAQQPAAAGAAAPLLTEAGESPPAERSGETILLTWPDGDAALSAPPDDAEDNPESEELALLESLSRPAPLMLVTPFRAHPRPAPLRPEAPLAPATDPASTSSPELSPARESAADWPGDAAGLGEARSGATDEAAADETPPAPLPLSAITASASAFSAPIEAELDFDLTAFAGRLSASALAPGAMIPAPAAPILPPAEPPPAADRPAGPALIPDIEAALQRVLSCYFPPPSPLSAAPASPAAQPPAPSDPRAIWRGIVARADPATAALPVVAMIDELLSGMFPASATEPPEPGS